MSLNLVTLTQQKTALMEQQQKITQAIQEQEAIIATAQPDASALAEARTALEDALSQEIVSGRTKQSTADLAQALQARQMEFEVAQQQAAGAVQEAELKLNGLKRRLESLRDDAKRINRQHKAMLQADLDEQVAMNTAAYVQACNEAIQLWATLNAYHLLADRNALQTETPFPDLTVTPRMPAPRGLNREDAVAFQPNDAGALWGNPSMWDLRNSIAREMLADYARQGVNLFAPAEI